MTGKQLDAEISDVPEISVLLCVYNGEDYLAGCLESILNQSFSDFEFIIVNDGSTDRSLEILTDFAQKDSRIKLINKAENSGITASVTEGLKYCRGKYIARMDQDDISLPDRFRKQHDYLETNPRIDVLGSSLAFIDQNGDLTGRTLIRPTDPLVIRLQMYYRCVIHNPSVLMRAAYYKNYNLNSQEKDYRAADDYSFWLRENLHHLYANLEEPCLLYRVHQKQTSSEKSRVQMDETLRSAQLAYHELIGRRVPVDVIESFYYIKRVTTTDPEIVKQGLLTIYQIQKSFEKLNRLTPAQRKATRQFSYEKLKSYIAKYRSMPGVLTQGAWYLIRLAPGAVLADVLLKFSRQKPDVSNAEDEE